ncbi:MAG: TolC family protein [Flavobacteriaceae bacterium]
MKRITIFIVFLAVTSVSAQTKKWTLQECVEHAMANNISLQQSALDQELSLLDKADAIGAYLPNINGSVSNAWNTGLTQNVTTGVLENQTSRNSSYSVTATLSLFQGLRNLRSLQRSKINTLAAQYGLEKMQDDIALFVANAFLQVLTNKANVSVLKAQNAVTVGQIERTQELVDAGVLPEGDLLEIQAADATEKQNIVTAENGVTLSLISLAQLLQIRDYDDFDIVDQGYEILGTEILEKGPQELVAAAREYRKEVLIAETNVALAEKDLQIARSAYMPTLGAYLNYNTRESDRFSGVSTLIDPDNPIIATTDPIGFVDGSGAAVYGFAPNIIGYQEVAARPFEEQLYLNDGVSYGVQMNIPIFNGNATRNNVKRSKLNLMRRELLLEQAKMDLETTVYQAFVDAKGALKSYDAAVKAKHSQQLAYEYAQQRYDVGLINAFDFSQSKTRYDNAVIDVNRAKYDYIFKLKVLELYFGVPVSELKF